MIIPVYVKMDISIMDRIQHAYVNKIFIQLFLFENEFDLIFIFVIYEIIA